MENVIFADSPLASYLEGEGKSDSCWIKSDPTECLSDSGDAPTFAPRGGLTFLARSRARISKPLTLSVAQLSYFKSLQQTLSAIFNANFSSSESVRFLEHFRYLLVASQPLDDFQGHTSLSGTAKSHFINRNGLGGQDYLSVTANVEGVVGCTLLTLLLVWATHWSVNYSEQESLTARYLAALFGYVIVIAIGWAYARTRWLLKIRQRVVDVTSVLVANLQAFESSTSSALTYIQEVELVSRGYRISTPLPPITRLEEGSTLRRCLGLRRSLRYNFASVLPVLLEAHEILRGLIGCENDYEKYLEVYDISKVDLADARVGFDHGESNDLETLTTLRVLSFRFATLRRVLLCALMAIPAEGTSFDFNRWSTVAEAMQSVAVITGSASNKLNAVLAGDEKVTNSSPTQQIITPSHERLRSQVRNFGSLSQGIRGLQAKMQILREESDKAMQAPECDFTDFNCTLMAQYESIGEDLKDLMQSWEAGKTSIALNMERQERRMSLSHGRSHPSSKRSSGVRSPTLSLGGQTAVDEGSPTAALRALNGEVLNAISMHSGNLRVSRMSTLAISSRPLSPTSSNDVSGNASRASLDSSGPSDEEIFEAIAMPRKRMSMTREERMVKIQEDQARQKQFRERRETTASMLRELGSVINLRQPPPKEDGGGDGGGSG